MPKICYTPKVFHSESLDIINQANEIIEEYQDQGYTLTLRQLYYQFVSRAVLENTERSYKRLGGIINDARLGGLIDWEAIEDRTRNLHAISYWHNPQDILRSAATSYHVDRWLGQKNYVEVWVEKEALLGVVEVPCRRLDVAWFGCRGYVSQSEMWSAYQRIHRKMNGSVLLDTATIIYLGDHDPSGLDMSRDIRDRMAIFNQYEDHSIDLRVDRIALNWDQIERYNPPPNPAKLSDSRATDYITRYGDESWELDALSPAVLDELISTAIEARLDRSVYERRIEVETEQRTGLNNLADLSSAEWAALQDYLQTI